MRGPIATGIGAIGLFVCGCAMLPPNSFLDPTRVGMFPLQYHEGGIRRVLTPREGPVSLAASAEEPRPEDLVADFDEYRLGPTDNVAVSIEDLLQQGFPWQAQLEISPTGYIRIPLLGAIRVTGLTEVELEQELRDRLREAGILPNPLVQVTATVRRNRLYYITGAVQASGPYAIAQPDLRLLDAIGIARDIGPDVKRLYVIRRAESERRRGEMPVEPQPERELVIPPPEEDDNFDNAFLALSANGQSQASTPPRPQTSEFEEVLAPRRSQTRPAEPPPPAVERPFPPLIFDPQTGVPQEAPPPPPAETAPVEPAPPTERKPFDWEAVEDYELSQRVIEIDVRALKAGDPRYNIVIRDRDYINVPVDTGVFYLMGEVNRPGVYAFNNREITIKQAVGGIGGGLGPLAWPQRCEIIRREAGTDRQITIPVNLDAIFAGLEDDVLLKDDDVVNVGSHVVAPFLFIIRNSFRFTYGFGFVYDRNFADKDSFGSKINPQVIEQQRRQARGLPF